MLGGWRRGVSHPSGIFLFGDNLDTDCNIAPVALYLGLFSGLRKRGAIFMDEWETMSDLRLLIITQVVDDDHDVLGFVTRWISALARRAERVDVLALNVGRHSLPDNTNVFELKSGGLRRYFDFRGKLRRLVREDGVNAILAHMCPGYVIAARLSTLGVPIFMWYAHAAASLKLRLADKLVAAGFTSSLSGYSIRSRKIMVVQQGIDTEKFAPAEGIDDDGVRKIVTLGRISRVKRLDLFIEAVSQLSRNEKPRIEASIIGSAQTDDDKRYRAELVEMIETKGESDRIFLSGACEYSKVEEVYQDASVVVSTRYPSSLEKSVLEAMACATPVVVVAESFVTVLGEYAKDLVASEPTGDAIAEKIARLLEMENEERARLGEGLRHIITDHHDLDSWAEKIVLAIKERGGES